MKKTKEKHTSLAKDERIKEFIENIGKKEKQILGQRKEEENFEIRVIELENIFNFLITTKSLILAQDER